MGWEATWVSSFGTSFVRDITFGFVLPNAPAGNHIFYKNEDGQIFHADSDDAARVERDNAARGYEMMSPTVTE
jgi:predicted dithiol-disulfide oxidoreductase (DUF899 family)